MYNTHVNEFTVITFATDVSTRSLLMLECQQIRGSICAGSRHRASLHTDLGPTLDTEDERILM